MRESRSDRIIARQRQCGTCQSEGPGFCTLQKKRFCDMDIWQDCQDYKKERGTESDQAKRSPQEKEKSKRSS